MEAAPHERSVRIYLSLGSNVGDREENLRRAIGALASIGVRVLCVSSLYETAPVNYLEQDWFLNCVAEAETALPPLILLQRLREIEKRMGSNKPFAKGPRLLDMDILLYGDQEIATPELQVPHPRMHLRRFVLVPLAELAPDLRHPSWTGTVRELLANTVDMSEVKKVDGAGFPDGL
jgi:2-amino-4-hydroxy-6-hydroxymethyldihydropteridine diphosphokinase